MGYNKLIAYGNFVELYEYEKNLSQRTRRNEDGHGARIRVQDLAVNGISSQQKSIKRADNARRATMAFRRLVLANLSEQGNPLLFTFTYSENIVSLKQGYSDFRACIQRMRYEFGPSFRYIAVPEFQKRGAVHFHALFWGLHSYSPSRERQTRLVASTWEKGFVYVKETDGNERIASYLSKYMAKSFLDSRLSSQKAFTTSRNILRPLCNSHFSPSWPVVDDFVPLNTPTCKDISFMTKWLGKGRYRLYNIKY